MIKIILKVSQITCSGLFLFYTIDYKIFNTTMLWWYFVQTSFCRGRVWFFL